MEQTKEEEADEIQVSDEYMHNLDFTLRQLQYLADANLRTSLPATHEATPLNHNAHIFMHQSLQPTVASTPSYITNPPMQVPNLQSTSIYSARSDSHKLPKLNIPIFERDILD